MHTRLLRTIGAAVLVAALILPASGRLLADPAGSSTYVPSLHLDLERSTPGADKTVESVDRISLWFTQAPQMAGTSIRLVPDGGEPMDLGRAAASESNDKLVELAVPMTLESGKYGVFWRAMAQDGHTVRGDFSFSVQAAR